MRGVLCRHPPPRQQFCSGNDDCTQRYPLLRPVLDRCSTLFYSPTPNPNPMTPGSGPSDLTEYEVPVEDVRLCNQEPPPFGPCVEDQPARWVCSCVELPVYARGWVPLPSPSPLTMLYTMVQVDGSLEDQVVHGRASTEQTYVALWKEPLVIQGQASLTTMLACR